MRKLKVNTVLYTRDGRKFGNGIIIGIEKIEPFGLIGKNDKVDRFYIIKTDYGNEIKKVFIEIEELFYIGKIAKKFHKHFVKKDKK